MNKLFLSKTIYDISAVKETILAFSELAKITLHNKSDYYICEFDNCVYTTEQTSMEFENYLIDLCNKMGC